MAQVAESKLLKPVGQHNNNNKNASFLRSSLTVKLYVPCTEIISTDFFFFLFKDGPLAEGNITFTATTTIMVTIEDIDNRPPWFQPCNKFELTEGVVVCHSSGYTGSIVLNEKEV